MDLPELTGGIYAHREHFAAAAGVTLNSLGVMISKEQLPPMPRPIQQTVSGRYAWHLSDVEGYAEACARWRANADERNAQRRKEIAERRVFAQQQIEAEARRLAEQRRIANAIAEGDAAARQAFEDANRAG